MINHHNWYFILPPILFPSWLVNNINKGFYEFFFFCPFCCNFTLKRFPILESLLFKSLVMHCNNCHHVFDCNFFVESLMVVFPLVSFQYYLGIWFHYWSNDWIFFDCYIKKVGSLVKIFKAMFRKLGGHFLVNILGN